jgi:hypothetical protein
MNIYYFKKWRFSVVYLLLFLLSSCQNESWFDTKVETEQSTVVLEQLIHQVSIDRYVYPDPVKHAAFLGMLSVGSPLGRNSSGSTEPDTVRAFSEIPLIREVRSRFVVFEDGSNESQHEDLTPKGINQLHLLSESPPGEEMLIAKTVIKDGRMKVFNNMGELLINEGFPENNLKNFVDSLLYYASKAVDEPEFSVQPMFAFPESINIQPAENGRVKVEQLLTSLPQSVSHKVTMKENLKAVVEMDTRMTRTLKFELFSNQQLIHRKVYEYDDDTQLANFLGEKTVSSNPKFIEAETLQFNRAGMPVIYQSSVVYYRNQTILTPPEK